METNEKNMSSEESLRVIEGMINSVKRDLEDDSFYYIIWGWLVLLASVGNYVLIRVNYPNPSITWSLMILGGIISAWYGMKQSKERKDKKVKTYISEFMKYVVIAFGVTLFIVLFFMNAFGSNTYALVLMVYGMWLFISGGAIRFKPLILGGILNWVLCVVAMFVTYDIQLLLLAAAMVFGFLIPGYMLKSLYNKTVINAA